MIFNFTMAAAATDTKPKGCRATGMDAAMFPCEVHGGELIITNKKSILILKITKYYVHWIMCIFWIEQLLRKKKSFY